MFTSCIQKQLEMKAIFAKCLTEEAKYEKLMELGRELPPLNPTHKVKENLVKGCQSTMYLTSQLKDGVVLFEVDSDALVSAGLAMLLIRVYNEETPETILKCPPAYLEELGLSTRLTPNRSSGLYSIHLRMKQDALKLLIESQK